MHRLITFTVNEHITAPAEKYTTPADLVKRTKQAVKLVTVKFVCDRSTLMTCHVIGEKQLRVEDERTLSRNDNHQGRCQ